MMRGLSTVVAVTASLLVFAGAASAAPTATAEFCNGMPNSTTGWSSGGAIFGGFTFEDKCADGDGLQIINTAPQTGETGDWFFDMPTESPMLSYSFDLDDGDTSGGLTYAASSCDVCGPDVTITSFSPGDPTMHVEVSAPLGSGRLDIYAQCNLAPMCIPTTTPLRISNIKITTTDETPPTVWGYVDGAFASPGGLLGWTNKTWVPVVINAEDRGFGVRRVSASFGGPLGPVFRQDLSDDCSLSTPLTVLPPCPWIPGLGGSADIGSLTDGIHDVTLSAEDAWGNSTTTAAAQLGIDRKAPAAPISSTLDFTASGWPGQRWTSDPDVVMHWPTIPLAEDPEFDSPQETQDLSIRRDGTPSVSHDSIVPAFNSSARTLTSDGEWTLALRYGDSAGNLSEPTVETIGLDADAPNPPRDLVDVDWLSEGALSGHKRITWSAPEVNDELESGVCGYVVSTDDSPGSNPTFGTDDSTIAPSWPLPAGLPEGTNYFHVRAVSCAGVASETVTAEIRIDTKGPAITLSGLSTPGAWVSSAQAALISATDGQSGVARVGYAVDHGAVNWLTDDHVNAAIPEGEHELTAYAVDVAGNASSVDVLVRTDTHAPVVDLETAAIDDPTRVSASVTDHDSGLVAAAIELRRTDQSADSQERSWQLLGGPEPITRGTTATVSLTRMLDDAKLPEGDYELRVNAIDLAGNSTIAGAFAIRSLRLPLRRRAEISAAVAEVKDVCRTKSGKSCASVRKCARKARCRIVRIIDRDHAKSSVVHDWPQRSVLIGDALDPNGAPIVGARVTITSTPLLHDPETIGSAVTDSSGHYEASIPTGPSRTLTARIGGSSTQQPAASTATVSVRSDIEFMPRPRKLRSGNTILLRGRVLHPEWLPVGGVSVSFQWYSPNGWVTFDNPVSTDAQGNFSRPYPWTRATATTSVKIRARIDQPAGWPFAPGSSDAVKITVLAAR